MLAMHKMAVNQGIMIFTDRIAYLFGAVEKRVLGICRSNFA